MVDVKILEKHGVSAAAWRKLLEIQPSDTEEARPNPKRTPNTTDPLIPQTPLEGFKERLRTRIQAGIDGNIGGNWRALHALDTVWEAPYRQISPTLLRDIIEKHQTTQEVMDSLNALGINFDNLIVELDEIDEKTHEKKKALNVPAFFGTIIPLCRAYLEIRWSKLYNDRKLTPLFPFQPSVQTPLNRTRTNIVSSRIQLMSDQYDYKNVLKEGIFHQLLYGTGVAFTREAWHTEESLRYSEDGKNEEKYIVREGLRYHFPHPSRTFWDQAFSPRTLNSDTGCEFVGYWRVVRYKEIAGNKDFYNLQKISLGDSTWWTTGNSANFLNTFYGACVINVPTVTPPVGVEGTEDREQWMMDHAYYGTDLGDKSVVVTEYRERLVPSEVGLGDYDYPIWARFMVAGDGTILYAEPLGYTGALVYRENGDEKRRDDASLALKLIPFEDTMSNLFSQFVLTAKQNLANLTLVDECVIEPDMIDQIKNLGERFFRSLNIFKFNSRNLNRAQSSVPQTVYSHRFPEQRTDSIFQCIKLVIDLAERVLQFSSQEVAQAASHQQTKAEVEKIYAATTNILEFTGDPIDDAITAHARQLYEAWRNYGAEEFIAEIPADHELTEAELQKLGITQDLESKTAGRESKKVYVQVKQKVELQLHRFAVIPATRDRQTNIEAANALTAFLRDMMNNPTVAMAIGSEQAISLFNSIAKLAGLSLDQPLRDMTRQNMTEQQQQMAQQVMGSVMQQMKEGLVPVLKEIRNIQQRVNTLYQDLGLESNESSSNPNADPAAGGRGAPPMAPAAGSPNPEEAPAIAGLAPSLPGPGGGQPVG